MQSIAGPFRELTRKRDFYAGGLMLLIGLGVALKGWLSYRLGTLMHMGPGFLPTALGVILALIGVAIAGAAASASGPASEGNERILPDHPQWWGWFCILAGPALFILFGHYFGLMPGTFACVFVAALGDRTATLKRSLVLALIVTVFGVALFSYFLQIPMPVLTLEGRPVIATALTDLWYGFGVALEPHNLMWCFIGVLVGNMVGVLPGMGPLATISILLPLTFGIPPVGAVLMLAGVMYGAQYGGAICSILLNLPCHPPHAVTCLDGFPLTQQGRGGVALGHHRPGLVCRRVLGDHRNDLPVAAAGEGGVGIRTGRGLLADAARPARRLDAGARLAAQGRGDDGARPYSRLCRHRS